MPFNSIEFAIFLPLVFVLYWFVTNNNLRLQNLLIVVASYLFYGWWNWRFLSLIVLSTVVNYLAGLWLSKETNITKKRLIFWINILINLGLLGYFKYFNFFLNTFITSLLFFGIEINTHLVNIILPVGISFYTFQTMSYSIDVYKKKIKPVKNLITFSAYVSFFPQLVAGPIERATHLLPQFFTKRNFEYIKAVDGMRQILWGLFKKMVIADNCAKYANMIFDNPTNYSGSTLLLGAIFFAFQIYGDFSGYSDIAIGTARLFGFDLMQNFNFPFFSRDIAEFWRRWHISLSTWFRDYVYIPLGGNRGGLWMTIRNTFIIFIISGLWHGANWTFIIWGVLNALYFLPLLLTKNNREHLGVVAQGKILPNLKELFSMGITFGSTVFALIFFRAESVGYALKYIARLLSPSLFTVPKLPEMSGVAVVILLIALFVLIEWFGRESRFAIENIGQRWNRPLRWAFYSLIIFAIGMFMPSNESPFIYFQF